MGLTLLSFVKRIKLGDHVHLNLSASPKGVGMSTSIKVAGVNVNVGKKGDGVGVKRAAATIAGVRMTKSFKQGKSKKVAAQTTDTPDVLSNLLGSIFGQK